MDTHQQAVGQKKLGFWLIVGGMVALFMDNQTINAFGMAAIAGGFLAFLSGRLKQ